MSGRFSTYERPQGQRFSTVLNIGQGAANKEDELFLNKLLSTFVNKQSSLFSKWIKVRITENNTNNEFNKYRNSNSSSFGSKQPKPQLLVLTPLRIISLPNVDSPKRMKQFRIIDIVSLFVEENNNYTNYSTPVGVSHHINGHNYLNVNGSHGGREKSHSKSSKRKLQKPRTKRTITNPQTNAPSIQVLKKDVNDGLLYPKGSRTMSPKLLNNQQSRPRPIKQRSGGNQHNSKVLQSYTIVHPSRNGYGQQQNGNSLSSNGGGIKIMKQGQDRHNRHHATKSSSSSHGSHSGPHSLSPPPSTSLEQNSFQDIAATEDDYLGASLNADEPLMEHHEQSKSMQSGSRSMNSWASKTKSYSNTLGGYNGWLYHCCIKFHKLDILEMSYDQLSAIHNNLKNDLDMDILDIYFESADVAQEFLDILQFYLFTLYRGVPVEYKPKIEIIPSILNGDDKYTDVIYPSDDDMKIGDMRSMHKQLSHGKGPNKRNPKRKTNFPFVPSQVFIDRYVAYCDAQKIPALDSVIDYVIHTNDNDVFDVAAAFSHHHINHKHNHYYRNGTHHHIAFSDEHESSPSRHQPKLSNNYSSASNAATYYDNATRDNIHKNSKNISQQQYVALGHALAFLKMYKKLNVVRLNTDDSNIATLMKIYETNPYFYAVEFNKSAIKKITMQSLSISLSSGVANLRDLAIVDINLNRGTLKELYPGLENCNLSRLVMSKCNLSEKSCVYLFTSLISTHQYKTIQHLNISHNTFGTEGTKQLSNFIYKSLNLHTLVCNDSKIDGNTFFNGLHIQFYNPATSGIKSHLEQLHYLDFSGNQIGEKGALSDCIPLSVASERYPPPYFFSSCIFK